ncbi:MAG: transglycosylase SLT domain-containing protein [Spirochaetes bacterium]|nr:transglycosylase SLT domain-containing protein [Spirochaetota bacterium]
MIRAVVLTLILCVPSTVGSGALPAAVSSVRATPAWHAPAALVPIVETAAIDAGVPVWILGRLLQAESDWRSGAVGMNPDGTRDLGVAQLGERWLEEFAQLDNSGKLFDPFDPAQAIPVAARYLSRLYQVTGDWRAAVMAYNCGLSRIRGDSVPRSTRAYVRRIFEEETMMEGQKGD